MAFTDDASLYLADFGVPVVAGAVSGLGIPDQNSEMVIDGEMVVIALTVQCLRSEFGGLSYGASVTVDGVNYKVLHQPASIDDGVFCIIPLIKA